MMRDAILNFPAQLSWQPTFEQGSTPAYKRILLCGMGGSHLAANVLQAADPELPLEIWSDYGLPTRIEPETLIIASSYSGNTEETLDAYNIARERGVPMIAIATGGTLLEAATRDEVPFIRLPSTGIQPRSALGFALKALAFALNRTQILEECERLATTLSSEALENAGKQLAQSLQSHVPIVYASTANAALAQNWKIKLNETGKIPAFYNIIPELNHNEMTGYDVQSSSKALSANHAFVFLRDAEDHPRNNKRFDVLKSLYQERGLAVYEYELHGATRLERLLSALLVGDWTALTIADTLGLESEQVPMVESFKKQL